ncbi:hypothetical protein CCHR01_18446 [Colletotrichum chrysophilum]|uniref:Uncharacterized protein n=1 Tax=Colletotrichum chrysophilum TaxID=1836956 RepID=A0AAD9E865_9PEZI|nr:hypothetical protein CCHR01_18446 [Colletotrichum chrysophilum]
MAARSRPAKAKGRHLQATTWIGASSRDPYPSISCTTSRSSKVARLTAATTPREQAQVREAFLALRWSYEWEPTHSAGRK